MSMINYDPIGISARDFVDRFPTADILGGEVGHDLTDDESTRFYINEKGDIGEARQDRRTTITRYGVLWGEAAEMVRSYYNR